MRQVRRVGYALVVTFLLLVTTAEAAILVARVTGVLDWSPVCALYSPDDVEYWVFFCWVDPPLPYPEG